jgi:Na+/H+-dicarboxylate symporter/ABC-type amino acid transport substrate-binding protein
MAGVTDAPQKTQRPFIRQLVAGLIAGIGVGLFFGERAGILAAVADGFVKLLQMAVLPYVTVSITHSIGSLRLEDLRRLGVRTALVLLTLWILALGCAFLMPLTFPHNESARFFSTTLVERAPPLDFVDLYIPANPFFALANNIVPAVVVFSIVLGVALIGVPRRQILLDVLDTVGQALSRATRFVVRLTPYGVFAIAATTAGTLRLDQVERLQLYLLAYGALSLLLALWVLPALVSTLTPVPMRAIFSDTREAVITAAVAGDLFIVLPVLITACKDLMARHTATTEQQQSLPDVIIPVSYNFPHSGKLLSISFVLFAGWFADASVDTHQYLRLAVTGVVTLFGSINAAMPFLLDAMRVPVDTFQLFVATSVINSRFGTLVAAMHTVAMAIIGTCAATGCLRWETRSLVRYAIITLLLAGTVVGSVRAAASALVSPGGVPDVLGTMSIDRRADATLLTAAPVIGPDDVPAPGTRLHAIISSRRMRVCYLSDALPYAYLNARGELVGYDVAAVHRLAMELGIRLEFLRLDRQSISTAAAITALLRDGSCDLLAGGVTVTTSRAAVLQFSTSYLDETVAFLVHDADRARFESWDAIRALGRITIATLNTPYYLAKLADELPGTRIVPLDTVADMFRLPDVDAIAMPAERGSAWTLRYPQYTVVVPVPGPIHIPLAFGMPAGEAEFAGFMNAWVDLKRRDGTLDDLYQYWILGRNATPATPRWSIIRDVLHWVD